MVKQALLGVLPHIQVHPNLLGAAQKNEHSAYETVVGWGVGSKAQIGGNRAPGAWVTGTSMRLLEASKPGVLGNDLSEDTICTPKNSYGRSKQAFYMLTKEICSSLDIKQIAQKL